MPGDRQTPPAPALRVRYSGGMTSSIERLRIGIVGCGDVVHRHYLPALASRADAVTLAAVADPRDGAGEAVAAAAAGWSPGTKVFRDVETMLARHAAGRGLQRDARAAARRREPDPPRGRRRGLQREADRRERRRGRRADRPGTSPRRRSSWWLRDPPSRSGCAGCGSSPTPASWGAPTLAVAHHADPGPAAWDEYTGDPTPFYREGVGPVFDHGVYRLHEMTTVLGPVRRVQAMGSIALPTRRVRGGPLEGRTIEVTTFDHVLIHLEFASGALGQLLASFATADTLAPWLEMHFERGVVSFGGKSWEPDAPVMIYEATGDSTEGWRPALEMPRDDYGVVETRCPALHRLPARYRDAGPHRGARPARPRRDPPGVRVDRGRAGPRHRDHVRPGRRREHSIDRLIPGSRSEIHPRHDVGARSRASTLPDVTTRRASAGDRDPVARRRDDRPGAVRVVAAHGRERRDRRRSERPAERRPAPARDPAAASSVADGRSRCSS